MEHSVLEIARPVRRRLTRLTQKPSEHARRAHAMLLLWELGNCVAEVARRLYAGRSSVQHWRTLYEEFGEQGLVPIERGRSDWKATDEVLAALEALMETSPQDHGYLRSRWSSELLIDPQEMHHHCREHLSQQKTPVVWCRVEEFPLTGSRKDQEITLPVNMI